MNNKLFVGSLPWATSDADLADLFAKFGTVVSAKIITDRETGRSRGFGFVEFDNEESANNAVTALNGTEYNGRKIVVNIARPRTERR